jgi:hypothetical protein
MVAPRHVKVRTHIGEPQGHLSRTTVSRFGWFSANHQDIRNTTTTFNLVIQ